MRGGNGNDPSVAGADEGAGRDETHEGITEPLVADAELCAQLRAAEGTAGAAKSVDHERIEIARRIVLDRHVARGDREVDVNIVADDELEAKWIGSGGGAVLDGEDERVLLRADMEVGVPPRVEVAASAKGLAGLGAAASVLACMMHNEDGDVVVALQGAEVAEQRRDLTGVVFVDALEANEGVEHEKAGRVAADGIAKARLIAPAIEAEDGDGDDVDGNGCELDLSRAADAGSSTSRTSASQDLQHSGAPPRTPTAARAQSVSTSQRASVSPSSRSEARTTGSTSSSGAGAASKRSVSSASAT